MALRLRVCLSCMQQKPSETFPVGSWKCSHCRDTVGLPVKPVLLDPEAKGMNDVAVRNADKFAGAPSTENSPSNNSVPSYGPRPSPASSAASPMRTRLPFSSSSPSKPIQRVDLSYSPEVHFPPFSTSETTKAKFACPSSSEACAKDVVRPQRQEPAQQSCTEEVASLGSPLPSYQNLAPAPMVSVAPGSDSSEGRPKRCHVLRGHKHNVTAVAFTPDCTRLVTASRDMHLRLWNISTNEELSKYEFKRAKEGDNKINCVAISPDGKHVASGGSDAHVQLFELDDDTFSEPICLEGHTNWVLALAFSPFPTTQSSPPSPIAGSSPQLASGSSDGYLFMWPLGDGSEPKKFAEDGYHDWVTSVSFCKSGYHVVTGCRDHKVRIWNTPGSQNEPVLTITFHTDWVNCVRCLPGTNLILTGSRDGHMCIWNYDPNKQFNNSTPLNVCDIHAHQARVTAVAWSPDGKQVASVCADACVRIWDTADGSLAKELQGHQRRITSVEWSPDGMLLATGSCDRTARIWDVSTSITPEDLPPHTKIEAVPTAPAASHGPIAQWLPAGMAHQKPEPFLMAFMVEEYLRFGYWFTSLAHSDDGTLLAGGSCDRSIYIWKRSFLKAPKLLKGHTDWVTAVVFVQKKYLISGSRDRTVRVWDVKDGTQLKQWEDQKGIVSSVAYCAKTSKVIIGSHDGSIYLWALKVPVKPDQMLQKVAKPTAFTPHKREMGERVYTVGNMPSICDQKITVKGEPKVTSVACSSDGKTFASGCADGSVRLHLMGQSSDVSPPLILSPAEGTHCSTYLPSKTPVTLVAFDSHGIFLAAATPNFLLRVWNVQDKKPRLVLERKEPTVGIATALAFGCSPDRTCTLIAVGAGHCTCIWDLKTPKNEAERHHNQSNIMALSWCFNNDDNTFTLALAGEDESVRLWYDPMGNGSQEIFYGHSGVATASRDGSQVAFLDDRAVWLQGAKYPVEEPINLQGTSKSSKGCCGVRALAYSPDGMRIAGVDGNNSICLWNRGGRVLFDTIAKLKEIIMCLAFMEANKLLAAGKGPTILVLELDALPKEQRIIQHIPNRHTSSNHLILSMAYSQEKELLATGGADHRIILGCVAASCQPEHHELGSHRGDVTALAFCNDGSRLVSGSADQTVRIWNTTSRQQIGQFHTSMVVFALTATTGTSQWNSTILCSSTECQAVHFYPIAQTGLPLVVAAKEGNFHDEFLSEGGWFASMHLLCKSFAPNRLFIEQLIKVAEPEWVLSAAAVILHAAMKALDVEFLREFIRSFTQAITKANAKLHGPFTEGSYRYLYPSLLRYLSLAPALRKMAEEYPEELLMLLNGITLLEAVHTMHSKVTFGMGAFAVCGTTSLQPTAVKFPKLLHIKILQFFSKGPFNEDTAKKAVEFRVRKVNALHGLIPFCVEPLSIASAGKKRTLQQMPLLNQLVASNNPEMFQSIPIQALVDYRWRAYARRRFLFQFLIYLAGLLSLVVMGHLVVDTPVISAWQRLEDHENMPQDILLLVATLFVVASVVLGVRHEIIQIRCASEPDGLLSYFLDSWNWIQWMQLALSAVSVVTFFVGSNSTQLLLGLSIYLRWFLILFYLQPFEGTGALVRMILKIVYDIKFFLIILGIAVLAGANSFYVLVRACEDDTEGTSTENACSNAFQDPSAAFFTIFNMFLLNAFDVGAFAVGPYTLVLQVLFVISMVLVPIILLNLLIALMGDSFQRINERASMELTLLRAKIILEVELFMNDEEKQKSDVSPPYLHVFVRPDGNTPVEKEKNEDKD